MSKHKNNSPCKAVLTAIAVSVSICSVIISLWALKISNKARLESLDVRNITIYQRYEDLFWSNDPVNEARAGDFILKDGNKKYWQKTIVPQYDASKDLMDTNRRNRLSPYVEKMH